MKKYWPILRTLTFLFVGILNTVLLKPEDIGTWKNYLGYLFLILVLVDISMLIYKKLKS